MSIETILPMDGLLNPGQHRLTSVQLVNWGTFDGAHTIRVDRAGTLLTGGSGVGKSTIFDGMLQVLDARPRMNEAAQTNSGQASEERRTAFSYMRGRLGATPADGDDSQTATFYQRPGAIWSAVCLTFDNALGQTTSLAVMLDLPANGTEHNVGRFYVLHNKPLDIPRLESGMAGRFSKTSLETLLPGSQVFDSHKAFAERFRQALGIDQEKAFGLLRTLQTGKGLGGTVNDFFRNHVLDTPRTLVAAEEAVQDFSHLRSIRRQLERVRQQRDLLAPVPRLHQQLRETQSQLDRAILLADVALPLYRRRLALQCQDRQIDLLDAEAATAAQELAATEAARAALKQQTAQLTARYGSEGGAAVATLERELAAAQSEMRARQSVEESFRAEAQAAGLDADFSPGGLAAARSRAAVLVKELLTDAESVRERSNDAQGEAWSLKGQIRSLEQEIESFRRRTSNIRPESLERRRQICAATGIAEEELPFAGELIDLAPAEARWRPAAERALRSLASALLVPGERMNAVTRYLNEHNIRGFLRIIDVSAPLDGKAEAETDDLVTKLVTKDTAMGQWVRRKITAHYDYVCVEEPEQLAGVPRGVTLGGAVKRSSSTTEKDDRHTGASDHLLGFDNEDKIAALATRLLELRDTYGTADSESVERAREQQDLGRRLAAAKAVAADTRGWEEISSDAHAAAVAAAVERLEQARDANTDLEQLRFELETAELDLTAATEKIGVLKGEAARLSAGLAAARHRREGLAGDGEPAGQLTVELASELDALFAPHGEVTDLEILGEVCTKVERELLSSRGTLDRAKLEAGNQLVKIFEAYNRQWGSDHGTSLDGAADYAARYHDIVGEGLPQREAEFREYFNNRTYERFSDLLQLLDEERRSIASRLQPLNQILRRVNYHADSHLQIEIANAVPDASHKFRTDLKNALPVMGRRQTGDDMDARYLALDRIVERLASEDDRRWRAEVLDVRSHVDITCTNLLADGRAYTNLQASLMSGGEGQRFTAFIMASALAYQLGIAGQGFSTFGTVMMDEAFVKSSLAFAEASINALHEFGFQLLLAAPEDKVDLARFLGSVTEVLRDESANRSGILERGRSLARPVDIVLR
ncbi:ATP-binding protein [Arthrobacter sulfonylureivorans]|uniref:ATP-binding protein n=1 Tax=Arthrobacter sulfonylureivorans TaxID=2486855 RepID=A0ABY3W355_9MICC|nr:ATP-binding protein [Arthrobacter sulfonylureivorans]UNK44473.1 ATP-binding protein [Arthrobacter sulfonylureivorans]